MSARRYFESNATTSEPLPISRSRGIVSALVYPQHECCETVGARLRCQPKDAIFNPASDFGVDEVGHIGTLQAFHDRIVLLRLERAGGVEDGLSRENAGGSEQLALQH